MILMADHIVSVNRQTIYLSTSDASHPGRHRTTTTTVHQVFRGLRIIHGIYRVGRRSQRHSLLARK